MSTAPFVFRRPLLLLRDLFVDRRAPDLAALAAEQDPESFMWKILPHAARTFASCIALLPTGATRPAAVAYLYCRCLDTYEDLLQDPPMREAALRAFAGRLEAARTSVAPAPSIAGARSRDARDASHVLLVQRHACIDAVFLQLPAGPRRLIVDLVAAMAEGMCWSSRVLAESGGTLRGEADVLRYCRHVLGNPVLFMVRLLQALRTGDTEVAPEVHEDAMRVGELIQLANITRDIEKDLRRGVAYLPTLRADLGRSAPLDAAAVARVRSARARLVHLALERAPSYRRVVRAMRPTRLSLVRASALLMLLFTERYYRRCARRAGLPSGSGPSGGPHHMLRACGAFMSGTWTEREMRRIERRLLLPRAAAAAAPQSSSAAATDSQSS